MKNRILLDILFYLALPLMVWKYGRGPIGDYPAMLLSTVPGTIYILAGFLVNRRFNITGTFILTTLIVRRIMDLLAGSSEGFLWNIIYMNAVLVVFWSLTMIFRQPMALYLFSDYAVYNGYPRKESILFFKSKELFWYFFLLTGIFMLRDLKDIVLTTYLVGKYGVDGYATVLVVLSATNIIFWVIIITSIMFMVKKINRLLKASS